MNIRLLALDVDGTLTDGKIYISANGEIMKAFDIKDGYALFRLPQFGIIPVIITGRKSEIVDIRCKELNIVEIHQGIEDKLSKLKEICMKYDVELSQCAYIGDDLNDINCMRHCGHSAAPANAIKTVRELVDYVCQHTGGDGAVREYCDYLVSHCQN